MIDAIMPHGVSAVEEFGDIDGAYLYGEEQAAIARAVPSRQREFATTRDCARRALRGIGVGPGPIPVGERRAPSWPEHVLGSMTHCAGYRAAAVTRPGVVPVLGIDAETDDALPDGTLRLIASEPERSRLEDLAALPVHVDRLLFSAKESVYKAWFPLARRWLGFEDADVLIDSALGPSNPESARGRFLAALLVPGPPDPSRPSCRIRAFTGSWTCAAGLLATAVTGVVSAPSPV